MAAAYSKLLYNTCYEVGHTWTPFCGRATLDILRSAAKESLRVYFTLYLVTALFRRRGIQYFLRKFIPEVLQSSLFLTSNGFLFMATFCLWRKLLGFYTYFNVFLCAPFCAGIGIMIEHKSRRGMLAIYICNLATEILFNMMVSRGYIKSLPYGEVLLFSVVCAVYMGLFRTKDGLKEPTAKVFRFLVGPHEESKKEETATQPGLPLRRRVAAWLMQSLKVMRVSEAVRSKLGVYAGEAEDFLCHKLGWLTAGLRHRVCRHSQNCGIYAVEGFLRMFSVGYLAQSALKIVQNLRAIVAKPSTLKSVLLHPDNRGLGMFLGSFTFLFRAVSCLLRWLRNRDSESHGYIAGLCAGVSMVFYRSSTLALYFASKLAETLWFKGVDKGVLPLFRNADAILYTVACAFVFHAGVFEQHQIRPAYWKFLQRLTGGHFAEMNRRLLDVYGTQASKSFPDFRPNYDPRFTSLTE